MSAPFSIFWRVSGRKKTGRNFSGRPMSINKNEEIRVLIWIVF